MIPMTLHTNVARAAELEMEGMLGALAGMTAGTGHHLAGSRIENRFADRMRELRVRCMATGAYRIDGSLGHDRMVGAMRRMAVAAGAGQLVLEAGRVMPPEGRFMAGPADMALLPLEQPLVITGMWGMAGHTAVVAIAHQVVVRGRHLLTDVGVAFEAGIDRHWNVLSGMAVFAAGGVGVVQVVAHQRRTVAAMRTMAGAAVLQLGRVVGVLRPHTLHWMTTQAERFRLLHQQVGIRRLVGLVAGCTLALGVRGVGKFELFRQSGVAGETELTLTGFQQVGVVRRMGIVATQTFPLTDRLMHLSLLVFLCFGGMAGIAELLRLLLKQAAETGHVRAVAGTALPAGRRVVLYPLLESGTLVAGETIDSRNGGPLPKEEEAEGSSQDQCRSYGAMNRHHFALPS